MLLPLVLGLALAPAPDSVELGPATWRGLRSAAPADVAVPAWAAERTVTLTAAPGGVLVRATWTVRSLSRGAWFSGQVLGDIPGMRVEQITWDGQPVATAARSAGVTIAGRVAGKASLTVVAFVPGEPTREPLALHLLPAVRGHVEVVAPEGLVATLRVTPTVIPPMDPRPLSGPPQALVDPATPVPAPAGPTDAIRVGTTFSTGAAQLDLGFVAAPSSPTHRATVVVARAGVGLTVGDAELRGRARLVWEVRQGTLGAVAFTAAGTSPDLVIHGPGVRAVQRSGDSVRVELQAPITGRLELDLSWSAPLAKTAESRAPLPQFTFTDVFRSESTLQLARDGEVEAVPTTTGMTPTSAAALPTWAQGLVEGTPTAAFRSGPAPDGHLDLLRFVPLEGPPVVVDVAAYTIATSREGRALIRAHYEVRNERAASLRVRPPPGFEVLGVRVGGQTATPARDQDGAWRVPLQRSVETVAGLLSFPVEIAYLGGSVPWDRREHRALPLPQLDAPVAVSRVTLHLPPGYRSRLGPGDGDVVAAFTRGDGITYGLGAGAVDAAEADAVFQSAVKGWLANDFAAAQADLDRLEAMGAANDNITRLQGNLDVIAGKADSDDRGVQRRIKEQARARSISDQKLQDDLRTKAAESRNAGDYEAAQSQYQAAIAVGDRLAKLEQSESIEQETRNQALVVDLQSTAGEFATRKKRLKTGATKTPPASKSTTPFEPALDNIDETPPVVVAEKPKISDAREVPVGGTTRDFTAIVDTVPAATADAAGIRLAGTSSAESRYVPDGAKIPRGEPLAQTVEISARAPGVARRGLFRRGRFKGRATPDGADEKVAREADAPAEQGLPTPKVTASAVSVVVPQVGQAVLYQRLLLPADAVHAIDVSAREPLLAKD